MAPGGCEGRVQPQSSTKGKFRSNDITEGRVQPQSPLPNPTCIARSKLLILYPTTRLNRGVTRPAAVTPPPTTLLNDAM